MIRKLFFTLLLGLSLISNTFAQEKSRIYPEQGLLAFGGLDDTSDLTQTKDNRAADLQNITLNIDGTAQKRYGVSRKNATLDLNNAADDFEAVTSIYELRKSTGTNYFKTTCGGRIFYDNSGAWSDITSVSITEGQNNQFVWTTALDNAIGTNGVDAPIKWDGTNNASTVSWTGLSNAVTKAKCVAWWKNYLIFGNTTEGETNYTTRIRWSNVGTIRTWSDDDYVDIATQGGQQIEGFGILYDNLIIFLTNSIYKISLVGGDELIIVTKVAEGVGCIAKNSIQNILINNTEALIFTSKDATVNIFDGSKVSEVSTLISDLMDGLNVSRLPYAVSVNDAPGGHYYLSVTDTNAATTNNLLLDFNYSTGEWSKHTKIYANALGIADDSDGFPQVYFGNYKAFIYQLNNPDNINDVAGYSGTFESKDIIDTETASGKTILYDNNFTFYDVLLMHFNGINGSTGFPDEGLHAVTPYGNSKITTVQQKFGTGSGEFDGAGDFLSIPDSNDFAFAAGNFTIDLWFRLDSLPPENGGEYIFASQETSTTAWWYFGVVNQSPGAFQFQFYSTYSGGAVNVTYGVPGNNLSVNTWYHAAVVKSGNDYTLYMNGTSMGTTTNSNSLTDIASVLTIGARKNTGYGALPDGADMHFNGWIDEVRISKGIARWTANFTSSTGEYSSVGLATGLVGALVNITAGTGAGEELLIADVTTSGITVVESTTAKANSDYSIGAIDAYWVSKWIDIGSPLFRKNYKDLFLWTTKKEAETMYCETVTDELQDIASSPVSDYAVDSLWGTTIVGSSWSGVELSVSKIPINLSGRYLKVKFSETLINEEMDLHSFGIVYEPLDIY